MLTNLGKAGRGVMVDSYGLYESKLIDRATFKQSAATALKFIADRGAVQAQLSYRGTVSVMYEQDLDPSPRSTESRASVDKIQQAIDTILDDDSDSDTRRQRLERLGSVLPIDEAQLAYQDELQADDLAVGWTRGLDSNGCELCEWWSRDGRIWPKLHPMPRHNGCMCQQVPAYIGNVEDTEITRAIKRREQAIANRDRRSAEVRAMMERGEL